MNNNRSSESKAPRVSVLMACYNAEKFLRRAVESILDQTFSDFEFIIIDDCSTDNTHQILNDFAAVDGRIVLLTNHVNSGLSASLNRGIGIARGEYIARMDADDASRPKRLEMQVAFMDGHREVGICGSNVEMHSGGKKRKRTYYKSHADLMVVLLFHSCFAHPSIMFRRQELISGGYKYNEDYTCTQDYDLWLRMVGRVVAANLPAVLVDYYCHDNQTTKIKYNLTILRWKELNDRAVLEIMPDASKEELILHNRISATHNAFSLTDVAEAQRWLAKLLETNAYPRDSMQRVFAEKWLAVCNQAAHLGWPAFVMYWKSFLSRPCRFTARSLKLFVKCIFGMSRG